MTSANLLIVLLVGTVVGALAGLGLGDFFSNQWYLALVAGFLGTIVAALVRDFIVRRGGALGPDSSRIPTLVLVYAVIASLAGSSAATEVAQQSDMTGSVWLGTLAGLFVDPDVDADDRLFHAPRRGAETAPLASQDWAPER